MFGQEKPKHVMSCLNRKKNGGASFKNVALAPILYCNHPLRIQLIKAFTAEIDLSELSRYGS